MTALNHRRIGEALVLAPAGRLDNLSAKAFERDAEALLDPACRKVVVDLTALEYIASAGLRAILALGKRSAAAGGGLSVCGARGAVKEVLAVSGFDALFGLHESVDAALSALG